MDRQFITYNTFDEVWRDRDNKYFLSLKKAKAEFMDEIHSPVADLGEPNPAKMIIEKEKGISIESIDNLDFDHDKIPGKWGTILCLEILEHLFNPLFFLECVRDALDEDGILYLSTPNRPKFLWTEHHFHEIDDDRIQWLFEISGFEIESQRKIRLFRGWKWHFRGIRPLFRMNTFTRIYKLRPVKR